MILDDFNTRYKKYDHDCKIILIILENYFFAGGKLIH